MAAAPCAKRPWATTAATGRGGDQRRAPGHIGHPPARARRRRGLHVCARSRFRGASARERDQPQRGHGEVDLPLPVGADHFAATAPRRHRQRDVSEHRAPAAPPHAPTARNRQASACPRALGARARAARGKMGAPTRLVTTPSGSSPESRGARRARDYVGGGDEGFVADGPAAGHQRAVRRAHTRRRRRLGTTRPTNATSPPRLTATATPAPMPTPAPTAAAGAHRAPAGPASSSPVSRTSSAGLQAQAAPRPATSRGTTRVTLPDCAASMPPRVKTTRLRPSSQRLDAHESTGWPRARRRAATAPAPPAGPRRCRRAAAPP